MKQLFARNRNCTRHWQLLVPASILNSSICICRGVFIEDGLYLHITRGNNKHGTFEKQSHR